MNRPPSLWEAEHRARLCNQARRLALRHKHALGAWKAGPTGHWEAACGYCPAYATVDLSVPGGRLGGPALDDCEPCAGRKDLSR